MLELATLGALMGGALHGYALKAWLERYMGSVITVNFGAIYPLLRRLREQGLIEAHEDVGADQKRATTYSITEEGRARFVQEMLSFPNESKVNARSRFLTKAYFFEHVDRAARVQILNRRLEDIDKWAGHKHELLSSNQRYRRAVFEFAQGQINMERTWVTALLDQESRKRRAAQVEDKH
jgi:DNA-binding PadR family transcriptional regulator